jgi:hypothetical protein
MDLISFFLFLSFLLIILIINQHIKKNKCKFQLMIVKRIIIFYSHQSQLITMFSDIFFLKRIKLYIRTESTLKAKMKNNFILC